VSATKEQFFAWGVHAYTMLGGAIGMMALVALSANQIQLCWQLLFVALIIDMTDGSFARRFRVREVIPYFDGSKVDDLIDFLTYVWAPVLVFYVADLISNPLWLALPVLGSLYAYGRPDMKEIDGEAFFVGFPSYWNVLALYMYWLRPAEPIVVGLLIILFVLSFIPTRYLYPSKNPKFPLFTLGMVVVWVVMIAFMLFIQTEPNQTLVFISLIYPIYYMIASFYIEITYRRRKAAQ